MRPTVNVNVSYFVMLLMILCFVQQSRADETNDPVIVTVLGKTIRYSHIDYDPHDKDNNDFYQAIMGLIHKVRSIVLDDFKRKNNLQATNEEIEQYWKDRPLKRDIFEDDISYKKYRYNRAARHIECPRLCDALYKKYGGIVKMTKVGPDPVGAHYSLLKEYEKQGLLTFHHKKFAHHFWLELGRKPKYIVPPDQVNFFQY